MDEATRPTGATIPLIAYVAGVLLLFAAARMHEPEDERRVVLTRAGIAARVDADAALRGRALTEDERRALVRTLAEEAVLFREAIRRRLDRDDPLIRNALLGAVTTELAGDVASPSEAEIRAYYDAHPDQYARRPSVAFEQAIVPSDDTDRPPADVLVALRDGADPETVGALPMVPVRFRDASRLDLVQYFGRDFADRVLALDAGVWAGPIPSTFGDHYVRITARNPSLPRTFEEVRSYVRQDLVSERTRVALAEPLAEARRRYDVRIVGAGR